jgi:uncharacterized protein
VAQQDLKQPSSQVNKFDGARQFALRWDYFATRSAPSAIGLLRTQVNRSVVGNINSTGLDSSSAAPMALPSQEGFWQFVEPGVRDLVDAVITHHGLITYTSCEGHRYPDAIPDQRHVGILPRNPAEFAALKGLMNEITSEITACMSESAYIFANETVLIDRGSEIPVIDIIISRKPNVSWDAYFDHLAEFTSLISDVLRCKPPLRNVQ